MDDRRGRVETKRGRTMQADAQSETLPRRPAEYRQDQRNDWVAAVEQVISDAETWATEQRWFVHRGPNTITEDPIGFYEVPTLLIQAPACRFVLEPMGRYIIGATGEIELSVFPSYESVLIVRNDAGAEEFRPCPWKTTS
jgi:hypothetical protein